jgi:hypothetical protein
MIKPIENRQTQPEPARRTVIPAPRSADAMFPGWGVKF